MKTFTAVSLIAALSTLTSARPQDQFAGNQLFTDAVGVGPGDAPLVFTAWTEFNFKGRKVEHRLQDGCSMIPLTRR